MQAPTRSEGNRVDAKGCVSVNDPLDPFAADMESSADCTLASEGLAASPHQARQARDLDQEQNPRERARRVDLGGAIPNWKIRNSLASPWLSLLVLPWQESSDG